MRHLHLALIAFSTALSFQPQAKADAAAGIAVQCGITVACAAILGTTLVVGSELNAKKPFGPNGEGMKTLNNIGKALGGLFGGGGGTSSMERMRQKYAN